MDGHGQAIGTTFVSPFRICACKGATNRGADPTNVTHRGLTASPPAVGTPVSQPVAFAGASARDGFVAFTDPLARTSPTGSGPATGDGPADANDPFSHAGSGPTPYTPTIHDGDATEGRGAIRAGQALPTWTCGGQDRRAYPAADRRTLWANRRGAVTAAYGHPAGAVAEVWSAVPSLTNNSPA